MLVLQPKIRWSLIVGALCIMAGSAFVSAQFVQKNDRIITALHTKVERQNELIRTLWQDTAIQENRMHMLALYTALAHSTNDPILNIVAEHYAQNLFPQSKTPISAQKIPTFINQIEARKERVINRIDDLYIEKIAWEEQIAQRSQYNVLYVSLALFMQLLSVAMITIVRDLK